MKYFIITTKGDTLQITEGEYGRLHGNSGLVHIKSLGEMLNLSFIYRIIPEDKYDDYLISKRIGLTEGRLSDGQKVIKRFGQWYGERNPEAKLNPNFYPEITKDEIMSNEEYIFTKNKKLLNDRSTSGQ